jgi:EAL domain-containing protein (putative c-di-GMP-specific phosphodiesterase class I)
MALDDFGAGYSGLARLALWKPDIVKLKRGVSQDCDIHPVRMAIINVIVRLDVIAVDRVNRLSVKKSAV